MTSLRKWRFPILIGSGLIAAGILFYFSNTHVSSDKTQGAIGQRDVYRDGQVNSADVATPGTAPVATTAILQSSEFKSLAKNPAFQELLREDAFQGLIHQSAFLAMLSNMNLRSSMQNAQFAAMLRSDAFQLALRSHEDLSAAMQRTEFSALAGSAPLRALFASDHFRAMAQDRLFLGLIVRSDFNGVMQLQNFGMLASQASFLSALQSGTAQRMTANLVRE